MRVAWDLTTLCMPATGIGRYTRETLYATARARPDWEFVATSFAVFFGSAYVMDDATFIKIFVQLREAGIPRIIDFHAGATTLRRMCITTTLGYLASKPTVRRLAHKPMLPAYRGKFHGYERDIRAIRKLYAAAGWQISEEIRNLGYPYTAVLQAK